MDEHEFMTAPKVTRHGQTTADSDVVAKTLRYAGWIIAVLGAATVLFSRFMGL